jgi:Xaa-Pro aminopeptidase
MAPPFAAFAESEFRDRLARARSALRKAGFDICIAIAPEHLYYLAGYDSWVGVNSPQALIFSTAESDAPTIVLRNADIALARESAWVSDLRTYHLLLEDPAALMAAVAREKGLKAGSRVAIEMATYALPAAFEKQLAAALAPARLEDASALLGDLRVIKSPAEIAYIRKAAGMAEAGLAAARRAMKPGATEIGIAAAIEGGLRAAGSDYWSIPTELTSGTRTGGGHGTPRPRAVEPDTLVRCEFSGVAQRYHAVALHSMALGTPPKRVRDLYRLGNEVLSAGIAATRVGAPVAEIEEASLAPLRREGLEHTARGRFGYGIGVAYPPIWLETLQISRGLDRRMAPGMVFVLHSWIELPEENVGVAQGGTWLLGENGLEMLVGSGVTELEIY